MNIAAIDIGSNAIRLAIAKDKPLTIAYRSREPVRLGSSVFSQGKINQEIYNDLRLALIKFKKHLEIHKVLKIRAVATSAMRDARNNKTILRNLKNETGIQIEIISGEEEARLVSLAIAQKVNIHIGNHILIDIGGGSIELIAIVKGDIVKKESFPIGMVRILEMHKSRRRELNEWLPQYINQTLKDFFKDLPKLENAVGTGGNMDRFIKLKQFISSEKGSFLETREMKKIYTALNAVDYNKRILKFKLKPDRADVIIPAAITTIEILKLAKADRIRLPRVGLKDGLLQELSVKSRV
jgi:exopolyphosphatase / guanosine-5'-triphosphate,3'-diphosphate pyrophosphatase